MVFFHSYVSLPEGTTSFSISGLQMLLTYYFLCGCNGKPSCSLQIDPHRTRVQSGIMAMEATIFQQLEVWATWMRKKGDHHAASNQSGQRFPDQGCSNSWMVYNFFGGGIPLKMPKKDAERCFQDENMVVSQCVQNMATQKNIIHVKKGCSTK